MAKKDNTIVLKGEITQAFSNANFKVLLDNDMEILCTVSGKMRLNYIRVMPGDKVEVELSPYDLTRGRISKRLSQGQANLSNTIKPKKVK